MPGDVIRQISNAPTRRMTHEQAKMEIIRAGNELDFFVHRSDSEIQRLLFSRNQIQTSIVLMRGFFRLLLYTIVKYI